MKKKAQTGIEYMIIVGFVTLAIMSILVLAIFYSGQVRDSIKLNHVENFAVQLINSAESVFFAGEPSKTTVRLYLPEGVKNIDINSDYISIDVAVSSGLNRRVFNSRVALQGNVSSAEGMKKITLDAKENYVLIG